MSYPRKWPTGTQEVDENDWNEVVDQLSSQIVVEKDSASDLIQCIDAYAGEKDIRVPTGTYELNEKITLGNAHQGLNLIGKGWNRTTINCGADAEFSIEHTSELDEGFTFERLNFVGTNATHPAIHSDDMAAGKRVRFLTIEHCRFLDFSAANLLALSLKNHELHRIRFCRFGYNTYYFIRFYEDGYNSGNDIIEGNLFLPSKSTTASTSVLIENVTSNKNTNVVTFLNNQHLGGANLNCLGIHVKCTDGTIENVSSNDRFEELRAINTEVTSGRIIALKLANSPQITFSRAFDVSLVNIVDNVKGSSVHNCHFKRGGSNAITAIADAGSSVGFARNEHHHNHFYSWPDAGSGSYPFSITGSAWEHDNIGYLSKNTVLSPAFDIATTGYKTVIIPHGLSYTPNAEECQINIAWDNSTANWVGLLCRITTIDATNVTCIYYVSTAGTADSTAKLGLRVGK